MIGERLGSVAAAAVVVAVCTGTAVPLSASAQGRPRLPAPVQRCRITDDRLAELSGLVSTGDTWYAVTDGGHSVRVFAVDPRDCSVRDVLTREINPYDVEDLEVDDRGRLWLADTGDNSLRRETVAVHVVTRLQGAELYRLKYPDGPHDAETMLLTPDGVPYIVTKDPFGAAGVYRPAGPLLAGETVPLERVGSVSVPPTSTPGGPLPGSLGSVVLTGGAVSHDGSVIALRTYTDAYLYPLSQGDVPAALRHRPVRVPLANEPQGEAIAFESDGTLLSASEGMEPVRAVPGAVAAVEAGGAQPTSPPPSTRNTDVSDDQPTASTAGQEADGGMPISTALLIAGVLAVVIIAATTKSRQRSR